MYLKIYYSFFVFIFIQFDDASGVFQYSNIKGLDEILQRTEIFFTNLELEFASYLHNTTRQLIDTKIAQFTKDVVEEKGKVNEQTEIGNEKLNQQEHEQESDTLNDFEVSSKWDLHNAIDVSYIKHRNNKEESFTFLLTLGHNGVSLLQSVHEEYIPIDFYSLANGESIIIIENLMEHNNILVVIKKTTGYTIILNLNHDPVNGAFKFNYMQTLITANASSAAAWYGMSGVLYLGITSSSSITIYSWTMGQYFELYQQIVHSGAKYLIPLRINETHATSFATAEPITNIFTFHLTLNRYILMQNLGESRDIVGLNIHQMNKRHRENFIVLVRNMSTIIYKNYHNVYVPFQRLELDIMKRVHSLVQDRTVYLLFVPKQLSEKTKVFRYNGWKFVDTHINLRYGAVEDLTLPFLQGYQWHFAAKFKNNDENVSTWRVLRMNDDNENDINWCDKVLMNMQSESSHVILSKFPILNQSDYDDADFVADIAELSMIQVVINRRKNGLEELLNTPISIKQFVFKSFGGKNVHALSHVSADEIKSESINQTIQNLIRHRKDKNIIRNNYELLDVTINSNVNYLCPIPAVNYKRIKARGLMNGIVSFEILIDDLLKLNVNSSNDFNCQIITAAHVITSVETIDTNIPSFDIAFNFTHRNIIANNITIDELEIIPGGLFLPVNHTGVYELIGTLSVKQAKIMKLIELNGHMNGTSVVHLLPIVHYQQPIILNRHFSRHFNYMQIMELVIANDIVGFHPKQTYNLVKSNSFSLDSIKISTHMILKMNAVHWDDVYLSELFGNWLTIGNSAITNVTGLKMIPPTVQLNRIGHEIVSVSRFENPICTQAAFINDVYTSIVTIDRARIQKLNADAIFGDMNVDNLINDHQNETDVNDANQFDDSMFDFTNWIRAGTLRGPVKSHRLIVDNVNSHKGIVLPLPREIKNMVAKKKCLFDNINGIDINEFSHDVATIHDPTISLIDMEFSGGLEVNEIIVLDKLPIHFPNNVEFNFDFGVKAIAEKIETENVNISFISEFIKWNNESNLEDELDIKVIVAGNMTFTSEPRVRKMNNWAVANLFHEIWINNRTAILKGNSIYFEKIVIDGGSIDIGNSFNTPDNNNKFTWSQFRGTVFSKSKAQNIPQMFQFDQVYVFNDVIGSSESRIISQSSTNLHNLEHYTFQKCHPMEGKGEKILIVNDWEFMMINSTGSIEINGKVNNLDLNIDVVRTDVEENVVSAVKTIDYLIANGIFHYSKINDLVKNALMTNITKNHSDKTKDVIISGRKRFGVVKIMNLTVNGEIAGKKIESCIQKNKTHQYFRGRKIFKGSVATPEFIVDEKTSINDIHLINFLNYHLRKKFNGTQIILNPIIFQRELKIFGNATIHGWYQNLRMIHGDSWNVHKFQKPLNVTKRKIRRLNGITSTIGNVISNYVIYWDKLVFVDVKDLESNDSLLLTSLLPMETPKPIFFGNLGDCYVRGMLLICNDNEMMMNFSSAFNITHAIRLELMNINDVKIFLAITSAPGGVIIFSYSPEFRKFRLRIKLEMPDIFHGSIQRAHNSLWMALDARDHTIIMRYNIWNEFQQYFLPSAPPSQTLRTHICSQKLITISHSDYDEELLFVRNDGIWRIGGVSQPKRIIGNNFITCPSRDIFVIKNNLYFGLINVHNNRTILLKALCINN